MASSRVCAVLCLAKIIRPLRQGIHTRFATAVWYQWKQFVSFWEINTKTKQERYTPALMHISWHSQSITPVPI